MKKTKSQKTETIDFEFKDLIDHINNEIGKGEWITVFTLEKDKYKVDKGCFLTALIQNEFIEKVINKANWEVHSLEAERPGFMSSYNDGEHRTEYYRYSVEGIEPLVFWRTFLGMDDSYVELSEEFRLFHNLFEKNGQFFHFDDNGDKHLVAEVKGLEVKIKLKYLKKYISSRNMSLVVYFDFMRFSPMSISQLGYADTNKSENSNDFIYSLLIRDLDGLFSDERKAQGWILGKKIVRGIKDFKPSLWGDENKKYEDFIIDLDDDGNEVFHTCDEAELANYFGRIQILLIT